MVRVLTKIRYHVKSGFRHGFKNIIFSKFFFGFVASIGVILSSHDKAGRIKDNLNARLNDQEDTFDFVIVGGGTAGSLLANRLSEQHKVLVLEAGGEPHPLQRIPGMALFMLNYRETDWMHRTVPQRRACFSSPGRRAGWCGGRNLGGSSNINYMVHMRGSPRDYDHWAKVTGDQSWSYEALLHYFRRHENYQGDSPDREAHGFDGDMMLEGPSYTGMAKEFIRAGQELGYEHVDLNARFEEGFDSIYSPMEMGERKSSFHAFLEPVRDRETLSIRKYSRVTKILIRSFDNTAFGVEYERHGVKKYAYATKEVVLCAGSVESPKLLMLSGIGPKTHLADLGIPVVADLPVGKNLQDHLAVLLGPFFVDPPRSFLIDRDITLKSFYEYKSDGNGPLSSSIFQGAAMISSKRAKVSREWNWPDILLLLSGMAGHKTFARDMSHAFNLNQKLIKKYYHHAAGRDSFLIFVSAARPQGRGDITLEKKDADAPPSVNPHYLENESDMKITIEGIKTALYLVENTTSFQNLRARFTNKKFPGCDHMPFRSDEYWECYTRHFSVSLNDAAGTCAMGHPDMNLFGEGNGWGKELPGGGTFLGAVVDPKLQVIGINHLRVADASVMPQITGSQTQAATLMIAEKAADIINEAWAQNENGPTMTTYKPFGWSEQMPAGAPQQHLGPPPQQQYGPPPQQQQQQQQQPQQYGPPPQTQYDQPASQPQYGPPPSQTQYGPPPPQQQQYGPPMSPPPNQQYGPPMPGTPPQQQYGPPVQSSQQQEGGYEAPPPPNSQYGAPPETSYGPPTMMTPMMEGGYMDMSTSSEPPMMPPMPMGNGEESQQMSEFDEMTTTTPEDETTTMMSTTTTTGSTTMESTSMETPPMVSYGPPAMMDSAMETTTIIPNQQYGPPNFQAGTAYGAPYNGWSGAGYLDTQYGLPQPPQTNQLGNHPGNSPAAYFTPPVPPGQDSTTAASSTTTQITSTENMDNNNSPAPYLTPPPGDRAEPPYQPQIGNPLFGGGQDPRNIPPPGDTETMSTTMITGSGVDPPEENAPAAGAFNPILATAGDSATSESSAVESSTFRSFYNTESPSGGSQTAAARPDVGFLEHDTKLRPGVQISNPFPDIYYATQDGGSGGSASSGGDVPESFFQKYPLTSSVEYGNKIPILPKISNGPLYFRNPEFTSRRPIVFGELLKKETSAPTLNEVAVDTTPYPFISSKYHFNKSAVATQRTSSEMPSFVPYYNDKNRRPDEGTVKPTVLYKSVGQTNKVPSTANVPNIYYSVKDKVSKEGILFGEPVVDRNEELMATSDGPPVMFAPTGPPPPPLRTSPSPIPAGVSGTSAAFGGSAQGSSNYWTNASPKPDVTDNLIQVEVQHGKDSANGYWTNASPKPKLTATPRGMDNSFGLVDALFSGSNSKRPGRLRALRRKPKDKEDGEKRPRIVRIKSQMIWTTTQRPSLTTTFTPKNLLGDHFSLQETRQVQDRLGSAGKVKIRVRTKEVAVENENEDLDSPILSPYWSQGKGNRSKTTTTPKPQIVKSGTSTPSTGIYQIQKSATMATTEHVITVTPRPMLSVQVYPSSKDKMEQAPPFPEGGMSATMATVADDTGTYLSHPGFGFDTGPGSNQGNGEAGSWQETNGNGGEDRDSMGVASVLPVNPHADDQTPGETFMLSNILGSVFRGVGGGRRRPHPPPPHEPMHMYNNNHYKGSTGRPSLGENEFSASGNSATRFMLTQVPDMFVQDDPEGPRSLESFHHDEENRKRFTAQDGLNRHHHHSDYGSHGASGPPLNYPTNPSGPQHGSSNEIPPPHHFDSGERERFNIFNGNGGVSSTVQPPQGPVQHPSLYHHNGHHSPSPVPPSAPTNAYAHTGPQQYHKPDVRLPPPLNPNYQVTTPGNDFSSPAYDENPLQFYRDATPQIPDRFQMGPTNRPPPPPPPAQPPPQNYDYPNSVDGNNYSPHHQQNHFNPPPSGPPPPTFIDSSRELGQNYFGGLTGPSAGFNAQTNNFGDHNPHLPSGQSPSPSAPPPPTHPSPTAFGLGHSAPVGLAGGNSLPQSKGIGSPPPQPFDLPHRFHGETVPENSLPPPPLAPFNNGDLGQIPDIFGFRNVLPSTVPPPVISAPPPTGPPHYPHRHNNHHGHSTPTPSSFNHQQQPNDFSVPQFVDNFSSPPTTALQQSISNILLNGPSATPQQHHDLDFPQYLGDNRPKVYQDGIDPNKISLTYDDTGAHGFLDPPVIMGDHESTKHTHVDINQISLTPSPGPSFHDQEDNGHQHGSGGGVNPSSPSGPSGPPIQYQESKHEDVTQSKEQILSFFGPQQDPEDQAQGDHLLSPESSTSPRTPVRQRQQQQPTRRPFGNRLHNHQNNNNRQRQKNPFDEFGDHNLFQGNPFTDLMLPQKGREEQQDHNQNQGGQHAHHHGTPTPHPVNNGFSVTPFESPDFTRFEVSGQSAGTDHLDHTNQFQSSLAPPLQLDPGNGGTLEENNHKMKEYTIYSNPDDVDITIDQGQGVRANGFGEQGALRRRSDNNIGGRRRKKRRHNGGGGGGRGGASQSSTRRGGRALRYRPLWGGDSRVPTKGRRRYYMLKKGSSNGTDNTTATNNAEVIASMEVKDPFQKRVSMETVSLNISTQSGTGEMTLAEEESDMAALSQELLNSFLGFGFGDEGQQHKDMLEQLLRNATDKPPVKHGQASSLSLEATEEDMDSSAYSSAALNLSAEDDQHQLLLFTTTTSTTPVTPTVVTTAKYTEWTPFEAATTNATITLSTTSSTAGANSSSSSVKLLGNSTATAENKPAGSRVIISSSSQVEVRREAG